MITSLSPSVGSGAASAGRSMPGSVRSASFAIAISAPVLPADTAAPARPCFTRSIATPIDVVLARRIAWLGFSLEPIWSAAWTISLAWRRFGCSFSPSAMADSSPTSRNRMPSWRRRARATPASITASPSSPPIASTAIQDWSGMMFSACPEVRWRA